MNTFFVPCLSLTACSASSSPARLTGTEGEFGITGDSYVNNMACAWKIKTTGGKVFENNFFKTNNMENGVHVSRQYSNGQSDLKLTLERLVVTSFKRWCHVTLVRFWNWNQSPGIEVAQE